MLRFLVLVLLVWLTLRWIESGLRRLSQASAPEPTRPVGTGADRHAPIRLVRCERCGVRVPENRARALGGGFVCTPSCHRESENEADGSGQGAP